MRMPFVYMYNVQCILPLVCIMCDVKVIMFHFCFQYLQTLEEKLKEAALKNAALLKENELLRTQVTQLEVEVCYTVKNLFGTFISTTHSIIIVMFKCTLYNANGELMV